MANFFDQFDAAPPTPIAPASATANYFDQFDSAPANQSSPVGDFFKSIPSGMARGLVDATMTPGLSAASVLPSSFKQAISDRLTKDLQSVTGLDHQPEGRSGKFGQALGEGLGNPISYVGPGSLPLKIGGAVLSSLAGEAGGQMAEGTPYEGAARLAGGLVGGVTAGKTFGARAPKAAIPNAAELDASADTGYTTARNSGVQLHPSALSDFAQQAKQDLSGANPKYAFTGGADGTAPNTFALLDRLQQPPAGSTVNPANLDALRLKLGELAAEARPTTTPGVYQPTADAKAASIVKDRLAGFMENPPANSVMAGNAATYTDAIKQANADYAASKRVGGLDARLSKAENAVDRQIAGSLESQVKSKVGAMLDNSKALRGLTQDEKNQLQKINSGDWFSNFLRQAGRLSPRLGTQGVLALATDGTSIPMQLATLPFYAARVASEKITQSRANKLSDMLAKRSPLYQSRVNALPAFDNSANIAAALRGGLLGYVR